jgi:hypothetical protein
MMLAPVWAIHGVPHAMLHILGKFLENPWDWSNPHQVH